MHGCDGSHGSQGPESSAAPHGRGHGRWKEYCAERHFKRVRANKLIKKHDISIPFSHQTTKRIINFKILCRPFWVGAVGNAVTIEADAFKESDVIYKALNSRGHHDLLQTSELV